MNEMTTLDDRSTGRYVVTTFSGTKHFVDLDAKTAVRRGAIGHEWCADAVGFGAVTPDGDAFRFWVIRDATVGKRMRLDNKDEQHITSQVQSIEEWNPSGEEEPWDANDCRG